MARVFDDFKGSYLILVFLLAAGIFIPPLLALCSVYYITKKYDSKPKVFDRKLYTYFFVLIAYMLFVGFTVKDYYSDVFRVSILGSVLFTIISYPFIYLWILYDYKKYLGKVKNIGDLRVVKQTVRKFKFFMDNQKKAFSDRLLKKHHIRIHNKKTG